MGIPKISNFYGSLFVDPNKGTNNSEREPGARRLQRTRGHGSADLPLEVEGVAAGGRAAAAHVGYFVNFVMPMLKTIHTVVNEKPYEKHR